LEAEKKINLNNEGQNDQEVLTLKE